MMDKKYTIKSLKKEPFTINSYSVSIHDNQLHILGESSFVYGLGERFNQVNQKGLQVENKVTEQFCNQGEKTYFPLPFFILEDNTGVFINTKRVFTYSFEDSISVDISNLEEDTDIYFFSGTYKEIITDFITLTGNQLNPPKWTLGPWMSGHRWNSQQLIYEQLDKLEELHLPITSLVIEQWSDEATFYNFNQSEYEVDQKIKSYQDYTYKEDRLWPNPKEMVDTLHSKGIKVLLWQAPVIKELEPKDEENNQHASDQDYVVRNKLIVRKEQEVYRIPEGNWFPGSMIPDFSNPETIEWWFNKRQYLMDIGFDGYKTDGGEFVHEEDTYFFNGLTGKEMLNDYSRLYIEAYKNKLHSNQVLFSRAGYIGQQSNSIQWSGDQKSTWSELKAMYNSGLSMSLSGQHLWSFDIGGFAGELPSVELYKRATQLAVFSPIMQFHSEPVGGQFALLDPSDVMNNERSPWNMANHYNDTELVGEIKKWYWLRMNIISHIRSELNKALKETTTLMRHLLVDFPEDKNTHLLDTQHMFGNLLVVPVLEEGVTNLSFYLPVGNWTNIFTNKRYEGIQSYSEEVLINDILVFINDGSAIISRNKDLFEETNNSLEESNLYAHLYGKMGSHKFQSDHYDFEITWNNNEYKVSGNKPSSLLIIFK